MSSAAQGVAIGGVVSAAVALGSGMTSLPAISRPPVVLRGAAAHAGHMLRDDARAFPPPTPAGRTRVAIVGGGVAGLSAAWRCKKRGVKDVVLLELDSGLGGNARSGANAISAFPWGAHYLPLPGNDAIYVREFLEDIGVITDVDDQGRPFYEETALCSAPQERLLIHGRWQDGIVPRLGETPEDQRQFREFGKLMAQYRGAKGADGRPAFTIPVDLSSNDPEFRALDHVSVAVWLDARGFTSPYLRWYVAYACKDDFGTTLADTSAWAGIHYFASRGGDAANAETGSVLTWPEGNGHLVRKLTERAAGSTRVGVVVYDVEEDEDGSVRIDYLDVKEHRTYRLLADAVVFAAPRYVAKRVIGAYRRTKPDFFDKFTYAPWVVANLSLSGLGPSRHTRFRPDYRFAWDNVSFTSPTLGYINATHQSLSAKGSETVLTHYQALVEGDSLALRRKAYETSAEEWRDQILTDMTRMHPGIDEHVDAVDLWVWGHGMIRPTPGFLSSPALAQARAPVGKIFFAHSDLSGVSIFEEAQYRGVVAADGAIATLGSV